MSWPHIKLLVSLPSLPEFHFIRRQPHSFYNVWPSLLGSTEVPKGRRKWPIWSPLMCIRSPSIQLCRLGNLLPPPRWWPCRGPAGKTGGETGSPVGSRCLRCTDGWLDNFGRSDCFGCTPVVVAVRCHIRHLEHTEGVYLLVFVTSWSRNESWKVVRCLLSISYCILCWVISSIPVSLSVPTWTSR